MRIFVKICMLLFLISIICVKLQANEHAEVKRLQQEAIELFKADKVPSAYEKIDALYLSAKGKEIDPILFNSNIVVYKAMDKYLSKRDKDDLIIALTKPLKSEQAKIVAYMLWSQVEQGYLDKRPTIGDLKLKISRAEGDLKMLDGELAFEEITKAEYEDRKNQINKKIVVLRKELQDLEQKKLPTAAEMNEIICKKALNEYNFSTTMHDFLLVTIVHFYHRGVISGVGITPEQKKLYATKCLENLSLVKNSKALRIKRFYDDFSVDALIELEKDIPKALKILDDMLQDTNNNSKLTKASILVRKGRCMLIIKNYSEAKEIAIELQNLDIKADPLKSQIAVFCQTVEEYYIR